MVEHGEVKPERSVEGVAEPLAEALYRIKSSLMNDLALLAGRVVFDGLGMQRDL